MQDMDGNEKIIHTLRFVELWNRRKTFFGFQVLASRRKKKGGVGATQVP